VWHFVLRERHRLWACCRHVRSVYPVHHNYAQGSFHLQRALGRPEPVHANVLQRNLLARNSTEFQTQNTWAKLRLTFSKNRLTTVSSNEFLGSNTFISCATSGSWNQTAENCPWLQYGYSSVARYKENCKVVLLNSNRNHCNWLDFQTIKNYNLPGSKAVFTGMKGSTKSLCSGHCPLCCRLTDLSFHDPSCKKRQVFKPAVLYTPAPQRFFWKSC
jgi:hypothetical protein